MLNNGNVLEGEIVLETPEEVVIKTDFGEMKIRRAQIKSIRKVTLPGAKENPREAPAPESDPKSILVPGTGVRIPPLSADWIREPGETPGKLVFRKAKGVLLSVEVEDAEGPPVAPKEFAQQIGAVKLAGCQILQAAPYLHAGFDAIRFMARKGGEPGVVRELYAIDAGLKRVFARFACPEACLPEEGAEFWAAVEGLRLRVPGDAGGDRDRKEAVLGDLVSRARVLGPEGPWLFVENALSPAQQSAGFTQNQVRTLVFFTVPWDGGGEVLRENAGALMWRFGPLAGENEIRNPKYYTAAGRSELAADVRTKTPVGGWTGRVRFVHRGGRLAGALGIVRDDQADRREDVIGRFLDSLDVQWDLSKALENSRWQVRESKGEGYRIKVPSGWQDRPGIWISPGGAFVCIVTGPKAEYRPTQKWLGAALGRMVARELKDARITGEGEGPVGRGTAKKLTLKGVDVFDNRFAWPVDVVLYHGMEGDRYFLVLLYAPSPGLETQEKVFQKVLDSFEIK